MVDDSNNSDQSYFRTPTSPNLGPTKETVKKPVSLKNDNIPKAPPPKPPIKPTPKESHLPSSYSKTPIVSFDPATYRLANGKPLSLRMQRALAKYDHSARGRLMANIAYYEQYAKKAKKPIIDHEKCLQDCINKDYAAKETNQWQNELYANIIKAEYPNFRIKILKTVVQLLTKSSQQPISISKDLPPETFANVLENAIRNSNDQ